MTCQPFRVTQQALGRQFKRNDDHPRQRSDQNQERVWQKRKSSGPATSGGRVQVGSNGSGKFQKNMPSRV